jgi:glycolate oxidase
MTGCADRMDARDTRALEQLIGKDRVLSSAEERLVFSYDASRLQFPPDVAALAESQDDVVKIMRFAAERKIPVYPRGAGSGQTGGSVPLKGGIALVLTRMNRILEVDRQNLTARVEPGVVVRDLKKEAERLGLYYPPDPASAEFATIGGTVAECAGGLRGLKYGVTRDYVLQLEVVTMGGAVMHFGAGTMKSVAGYDMIGLLVGSEGTLGVFTEIKLKLIPKPQFFKTLIVIFNSEREALDAALAVVSHPLIPAALEFLDSQTVACAHAYKPVEFLESCGGMLLVEFDGAEVEVDTDAERARSIFKNHGAAEILEAIEAEERERLWDIRRSISPALFKIAPSKANEDICVPRSAMPRVLGAIRELEKHYSVKVPVFAHVGDGNLHVNFMYDEANSDEKRRVEEAIKELFSLAVSAGGTLSGEHGIGLTKAAYLGLEFGTLELEMMKRTKRLWDPENLLNPGKIFVE